MNTRASLRILGLLVWGCATAGAWAANIYVDTDAPGANNGTSWLNAYRYLQDALAVAQPGDTIKVAQGVYKPNQATGPVTPGRSSTFTMGTGVVLLGGFAGYGPSPSWPSDDRNPAVYPTILSGDLNGNDWLVDPNNHTAIGLLLTDSTRQDNSYTVVTASYTDASAVLDGFTVTGGIANGTTNNRGGGLICYQGSPTIQNCIVRACAASDSGGGMYATLGEPNVAQCNFVANFATAYGAGMSNRLATPGIVGCRFEHNLVAHDGKGGGVSNDDSNSVIVNTTFHRNYGGGTGGGIYNVSSDPNIVGCTFSENTSRGGAGVENGTGSNARITRCTFKANNVSGEGGAVESVGSTVRLVDCTFMGNRCTYDGGAVCNHRADADLVNCLFDGNKADEYGAGVSCYESDVKVTNCTFASNTAQSGEALACSSTSPPDTRSTLVVVNSILWDSGSEIYVNDNSDISVTYSNLHGWWPGTGNIAANPQFTDRDGVDGVAGNEDDKLTLSGNSWCIDAGNNSAVPADITRDLAGKTRRIDDPATVDSGKGQPPLVDMGAYEYGIDTPGQNPPVANAGQDRTVYASGSGYASVVLDGSGSYDPDGSPLEYTWTWTIGVQVYHATGVKPTVDLPVGQHLIELVVFDGTHYSNPDTVQITVLQSGGLPPVANAGPDQTAYATAGGYASVQLDGSGSYDPEGFPLTYSWTWTIGSQTYNATGVKPTVQFPVGQHTVYLTVHDGTSYSNPDTVRITVLQSGGLPPIANAGPDQTANATAGGYANVQLNGSGSYDPDGSPLTYSWTWVIGSQTYHTTGVAPVVQLPVGVHTIELIVFDGSLYSNPDTVQITVLPTANQAPVANAGTDRTVYASAGGYAILQLNGSGSYDPEGSPLTYSWTWTIGSQTYSATGVSPTVQLPVGVHNIGLIVFDGSLYSNPDYVKITVLQTNQAPVANAGTDRTVYATAGGYASVQLNGSGSYDPEGSPLTYSWTWTIGSQTYVATSVNPTIQLPVGVHNVRLIVFDGSLYSNADYVQITVLQTPNQAPVANAGTDRTAYALAGGYATVQLNGSGSYDPEGSPLTYTWTWTVGVQTYHATGVSPTVQLPVGVHNIELIVFDGSLYSNPDYVLVTVLQVGGQPPVANAGPDKTAYTLVDGLASVQLDGSGSYDPEGSPLTYTWTWTIGVQTFSATGASPTVQLPVGVHTIELVVFDGTNYSSPDDTVVTVAAPLEYPMWLWPFVVDRSDTHEYLVVLLTLPQIALTDIDLTVPLVCYPGQVHALAQHGTEGHEGGLATTVLALFQEEDVLNAIPEDGLVEVTVVGQLVFGQWFSGTAQVVLAH